MSPQSHGDPGFQIQELAKFILGDMPLTDIKELHQVTHAAMAFLWEGPVQSLSVGAVLKTPQFSQELASNVIRHFEFWLTVEAAVGVVTTF